MTRQEILSWLHEDDPLRLEQLWQRADATRARCVGDAVHLRGLIEFSNICRRNCGYCGLHAGNRKIVRYRMAAEEILECAEKAVRFGYGTVVLQSGEDGPAKRSPVAAVCADAATSGRGFAGPGGAEWLAQIVRQIKQRTGLAVTLSVGERPEADLRLWRQAGADRYLLRFETSNPELFERIHPPIGGTGFQPVEGGGTGFQPVEGGGTGFQPVEGRSHGLAARIAQLGVMRDLGYQIGSGVMIGIPGQTYDDLARDIELFAELDLDMIGVGPFLPHPDTLLGSRPSPLVGEVPASAGGGGALGESTELRGQVPNSELMTYKVVALARLVCPHANIPSTTALATVNIAQGRELGLMRGANIVMPNLTPVKYRELYEIYPAKACVRETAEQCHGCLRARIESIGRHVGTGPGHTVKPPPSAAVPEHPRPSVADGAAEK